MINSVANSPMNNRFFLTEQTVNDISTRTLNQYNPTTVGGDTVTLSTDKDKKSKKGLIGWIAGASAITLIAGVAILSKASPKFFQKSVGKLRTFFEKQAAKVPADSTARKFYDKAVNATNWTLQKIDFTNTLNNLKDIGYNRLCKSKFLGGENSLLVKINRRITKFFTNMAQNTVYRNYHNANSKYNDLIEEIYKHKGSFSAAEWANIEKNIANLQSSITDGFSHSAIANRLRSQQDIMRGLDEKVLEKTRNIFDKRHYRGHSFSEGATFVDGNLRFYTEEILAADKAKYADAVKVLQDKITCSDMGSAGKVQELLASLKGKIPQSDYDKLVAGAERADKALQKAVKSETHSYFDKFRDLSLGGAPTDIVTVVGSSAIAGAVIARADNKDERISKTLTKGIPIVGTITSSLLLGANLISGSKGLLISGLIGLAFSHLGSLIDKARVNSNAKRQLAFQTRLENEIKKRNQASTTQQMNAV